MIAALTALLLHLPSPAVAHWPVQPPAVVVESELPAESDRARFDALMAFARDEQLAGRPLGEIAVALGDRLRGTPYVAGILDGGPEETLIAPLDRFDCVLFVESVLALARGVADGDDTYDGYLLRVEQQRYRGGAMRGYGSRLHYFSDWIADNAARGLVENVTGAIGGEPYAKSLTFMSAHRSAYPRLRDDVLFGELLDVEARLAAFPLMYVPKGRVREVYGGLQSGDVLATTTDTPGLDVTHTGFAVVSEDGRVGFLHASPGRGVIFVPDLADYLARNPRQTGIMAVRPL